MSSNHFTHFTPLSTSMPLRKFISREVGNKIKMIRLALHMSQERFGKAAGNYSQDTVAKWESGQVPPALILKRISEMSDPPCSVDWILDHEARLGKEENLSQAAVSNGTRKIGNMIANESA